MDDLWNWRLNAKIAAVAVHAGVVCKPFRVATKAKLVVRLMKVSRTQHKLTFVVALESCAGNDVEHSIRPVPELGSVAAAIHFHVVDVFGIELRAEIRSDIRVWNRHTVHKPTRLMPSANMKLVMGHVAPRNIVRNHGEAVGSRSTGCSLNLLSVYESGGSNGVGRCIDWGTRHVHRLFRASQIQLEMSDRLRAGINNHGLEGLHKSGACHRDRVFANWHRVENKLAACIGVCTFSPIRRRRLQHHHRTFNGTMLRIVHDAPDGAEDCSYRSACG